MTIGQRFSHVFSLGVPTSDIGYQGNMTMKRIPTTTPLLYSKTGVCRGIPIFLIFGVKHRLRILVRTASRGISPRRF